ncbi:iron-sulfur cluster assembly accessory protein [Agromyces archimandritae]|uniref:Iron-sulfur cluster assembly accessory protein n=1 Tax=Agromyces archimandritae TaxID=2781962 RepID=A0A975FK08_9MICO|nr:iron-sulfur cluster assembly accessory protein [Agromyces archimandritae]QTX03357.1 iron-sulfur cluster assembly accessory protein [Agromyces archimandritae]
MLTLTETASTVVKTIVAQNGGSEQGGLRINAPDQASTDFAVSVVETPEALDAVVENDGARVYLGENAAIALDDKILDAEIGQDGTVRFAIATQA